MTLPVSPFRVVPLDRTHDRSTFSCGVESLDRFLREQATQYIRRDVAVTFVLLDEADMIAGYYTLSQTSVNTTDLPEQVAKRLPSRIPIPATLLGRLARDMRWRGRGVGELLMMSALRRAYNVSRTVASYAVVVDALDENAKRFYEGYGFASLLDNPLRLYLPMQQVGTML